MFFIKNSTILHIMFNNFKNSAQSIQVIKEMSLRPIAWLNYSFWRLGGSLEVEVGWETRAGRWVDNWKWRIIGSEKWMHYWSRTTVFSFLWYSFLHFSWSPISFLTLLLLSNSILRKNKWAILFRKCIKINTLLKNIIQNKYKLK